MTTNLPLIRLSAINPFLLELKYRGVDPRLMLRDLGLPTDVPASHDLFVASETIYQLVERSADMARDKYLGFAIGSALELHKWEPIAAATEQATTVGELLTMFAINAADHSSATTFHMSTDGERATFSFKRVKEPTIVPAQNDAFYMGFMRRLLKHAAHDRWDAAKVMFTVADPDCIPASKEIYRIAKGGKIGVQIRFPSEWLFDRFEKSKFRMKLNNESSPVLPRSMLDALRSALAPHVHESDLTADRAAKICGHDRRRLSRELREMGTTLSKEIACLRCEAATQALSTTNESVAEIAESVGFSDPTIFSRAFKKWTGKSPREYRRTHRSSEPNGD